MSINATALGIIKGKDGMDFLRHLTKMASTLDERNIELEKEKVRTAQWKQTSCWADKVIRACRYELSVHVKEAG